jgi:hypothetical protein
MTPKEKAAELINKMYYTQSSPTSWMQAKQCAIIAVDEIGTLKADSFDKLPNPHHYFSRNYWKEVKQEIEAL